MNQITFIKKKTNLSNLNKLNNKIKVNFNQIVRKMMTDIHLVEFMIKMVFTFMLMDHLLILLVISLTLTAKMSLEDTMTVIIDIMSLHNHHIKIQHHIHNIHNHKPMKKIYQIKI